MNADVNNASGVGTTFRIFVICAKAPKKYQIVQSTDATAFAGSQGSALATCPAGTVPFGGGGISRSPSTDINMNSTFPTGNTWRTDMNNPTGGATQFASLAICAKQPQGYRLVTGTTETVFPGLGGNAQAFCPGASLPLGGGVVLATSDVRVNINATFPASGDGWSSFANNGSPFEIGQSARIVCAGI